MFIINCDHLSKDKLVKVLKYWKWKLHKILLFIGLVEILKHFVGVNIESDILIKKNWSSDYKWTLHEHFNFAFLLFTMRRVDRKCRASITHYQMSRYRFQKKIHIQIRKSKQVETAWSQNDIIWSSAKMTHIPGLCQFRVELQLHIFLS